MNKREARKEFKSRKTPKGIYAVRCSATGDAWVGSSTHLDSQQNGIWYQLRNGLHMNKAMQAAWNAHGEPAFSYQVLETFDEDLAPLLLNEQLKERRKHWEQAIISSDSPTH